MHHPLKLHHLAALALGLAQGLLQAQTHTLQDPHADRSKASSRNTPRPVLAECVGTVARKHFKGRVRGTGPDRDANYARGQIAPPWSAINDPFSPCANQPLWINTRQSEPVCTFHPKEPSAPYPYTECVAEVEGDGADPRELRALYEHTLTANPGAAFVVSTLGGKPSQVTPAPAVQSAQARYVTGSTRPDQEMREMAELAAQMDQLDRAQLQELVVRADQCTQTHNFDCADESVVRASRLARGPSDSSLVGAARQRLLNEKDRVEREQRAAEERRIALEAEREEQRREESQDQASSGSGPSVMAIAGAAISAFQGQVGRVPSFIDTQNQIQRQLAQQQTALNATRSAQAAVARTTMSPALPRSGGQSTTSSNIESPLISRSNFNATAPENKSTVNLAPDGRRIPAVQGLTVSCTNESGTFSGVEKVPASSADCRAEVIAHRQIQCRSDWMQHPATIAMKACLTRAGVADLPFWPRID